MPELIERSSLLDELDGALAATATHGRIALVCGEAGIGKSALVRRFTERHAAGARVLVGACDPLLTPRALGPLHDVGRQAGGRLAAMLASGGPREQLFAALLDELDRATGPQIVGRLSLSPKTVGHHVSAVLAKLGVASRRQAAATARQRGALPAKDGEPGGPS